MTHLCATGHRAKNLFAFSFELCFALRTRLSLIVPLAGVILLDRTGSASFSATRCFGSAVGAVFGIFCRCAKLSAMYLFMTRYAQRHTIVNINYQFWIGCHWFDMMSVNSAARAAMLTSKIVTMINIKTPFNEIAHCCGSYTLKRFPSFPIGGRLSGLVLSCACPRTIDSRFIFWRKHDFALRTLSRQCRTATRPARFGAPFSVCSAGLNFKRFTAHLTRFYYAVPPAFRSIWRKTFDRAILLRLK